MFWLAVIVHFSPPFPLLADANFLLRFLRVKKFSLPMAQQTLLKYLNMRQTFSHLLFDLDASQSKVEELIDSGYIFASPVRDAHGRRVIIGIGSEFSTLSWSLHRKHKCVNVSHV